MKPEYYDRVQVTAHFADGEKVVSIIFCDHDVKRGDGLFYHWHHADNAQFFTMDGKEVNFPRGVMDDAYVTIDRWAAKDREEMEQQREEYEDNRRVA